MLRRRSAPGAGALRAAFGAGLRRAVGDLVEGAEAPPWLKRRSAAPRERPRCLAERGVRKLVVRGREFKVDAGFWEHVADEQSVRQAAVYKNNCENYVGTIKYPVGVIGPLRVNGEHSNREYIVPMATHEAELLASYDRGAKAITEAGGVTARIKRRCMLRAPMFRFRTVAEATDFYRYAESEEVKELLCEAVHEAMDFCTVTHVNVFQTDRKVHISIGVDSSDAATHNLATYAGDIVMQHMSDNYPAKIDEMFIEGGFNAGKRVSIMHTLLGKGHSVVADCVIPYDVVDRVLHTTPYRLQRFQKIHNATNGFIGSISSTAHVANGLAAFFIATGNDPACVAESQAAVTHFDLDAPEGVSDLGRHDLYASITLNSLILSCVGSGTQLPSFHAARSIMGVRSVNELAEVCAAMVLAGELSLFAAIENGEFSHRGRSTPRGG